jgi:hypothetical protein
MKKLIKIQNLGFIIMPTNTTIKCPNCNTNIDVNDILYHQLEDELKQKEEITELVFNILDEREQHSEKTLVQMYDPDKMPQDLKEAHHQLDLAIEKCYRNKPFENNEERLEYLFKLYEEIIRAEE